MPYYRYKPSEGEVWIEFVLEIFIWPFRVVWWIIAGSFMLVMKLVRRTPKQKLQAPNDAITQGQIVQAVECSVCHEYNEATRTHCYSCSSLL